MRYAIEMYFDKNTENKIMNLIRGIAEHGISRRYLEWKTRPHITIGLFNDIDIHRCDHLLTEIAQNTNPFSTSLSSIGIFNKTKGVFLAPIVNEELIQLHRKIHRVFNFCDHTGWEFYLPGNWVPHCTIMLGKLDIPSALIDATSYVVENYKVIEDATFEEISFVEIVMPVKEMNIHKLIPR